MKFTFLSILAVACSPALLAQSKTADKDVLFQVNDRPVTVSEFEYIYRKNNANRQSEFTKAKIDEYLDLFVNFKLKVEEARQRGMDTTDSFRNEFATYHDELRKPFMQESKWTDSLTRLTYDRLKQEVKVSHILVALDPNASPADTLAAYERIMSVRKRALAGEDFATLAQTYSDDPSSRVNKGELGYFTALQMVYPFEAAAYSGKVGDLVGPVRTRFGYHLLKIEDRRPSQGQIAVSHIMVRTGPQQHSDDEAKRIIFDVYDQLKGGLAWDELCAKYSEDPGTKDNGGKLRPFGVRGMASVPEFEEAAFSLRNPGDYSDPFKTAYGWHIVRRDQRTPLAPYDSMAQALKAKVERDERSELSENYLVAKQKKKYAFAENAAAKAEFFSRVDSTIQAARWYPVVAPKPVTLFTLKGEPYTDQDVAAYVKTNERPNQMKPEEYLDQLYQSYVRDQLTDLEEQDLMKNNQDYKYLLQEYYEGILLFDIMEKEVWNKASDDTLGQQAYYSSHREDFKAGYRAQADIYWSNQKDSLSALQEMLNAGDTVPSEKAVAEKGIRAEHGRYEKEDYAVLKEIPWKAGIFTAEKDDNYYLVVIHAIVAPGIKTFPEARASVITEYQDYLEKRWIGDLKAKYPVSINEKARKKLYKDLL